MFPPWARTLFSLLAVSLTLSLAPAQIFVDPMIGNDQTGTGDSAAPFRSVTRALATATSGGTIHAAAGFYSAVTGEVLPLQLVPGVRVVGDGSRESFLTGNDSGTAVLADRALDQTTSFEGFTISRFSTGIEVRSAGVLARFVDVKVEGGSFGARIIGVAAGLTAPRFEDCSFSLCRSQGAIVSAQAASDLRPVFLNCEISGCTGGGIGAVPQTAGSLVAPVISYCTLNANGARGIYADPGAGQAAVEVYNSIVAGHSSDLSGIAAAQTGTNLLGGGPLVGLRGNFTGNPAFLDDAAGDFHLLSGSAACDRADSSLPEQTAVDRDGQGRQGNGLNDVGADERELQTLYKAAPDGTRIGKPLVLRHIGSSGDLMVLMLSLGKRSPGFNFPGLSGSLILDVGILLEPIAWIQIQSATFADVAVPIPDDSGLVGVRLFFQSVGVKLVGPNLSGGFSGLLDPVLLTR